MWPGKKLFYKFYMRMQRFLSNQPQKWVTPRKFYDYDDAAKIYIFDNPESKITSELKTVL